MKDISNKSKKSLQAWATLIAKHVRNEMEDFHSAHLNDAQMKELNPIIRNAIYQVLRQVYFFKKGTKKQRLVATHQIHFLLLTLPEYWEAPDLSEERRVNEDKLAEMELSTSFGMATDRSSQAFMDFVREHLRVLD